jgi:hypothetical protein
MSEDWEAATQVVNFEEVAYFRVPSDWILGREEDGGLLLFEDRPGSGTLRLWTEEYVFADAAARDLAAGEVHDGLATEPLSERARLSYDVHDGDEGGQVLRLHQWILAIHKGANRLRVITFTHTIEAGREASGDATWELQVVTLAVRNAFYPDAASESAT